MQFRLDYPIPNKSAWGSPITNFSALGRRRVDIKVGIDIPFPQLTVHMDK